MEEIIRKRMGAGVPPGLQIRVRRPERVAGWVRFPHASATPQFDRDPPPLSGSPPPGGG